MRKTASVIAALSIISTSLAACNVGDNNAMDTRYNDNVQPIGYYTGDREQNNQDFIDNDGPLTEMFDGGMEDTNYGNRSPLTVGDRDRTNNIGKYDRDSYNYHGHLGNNTLNENNRLAERISDQVAKLKNIEDVNTLVTENNVVVAVDTNDRNDVDVKERVKTVAENIARGKNINVVTDEGTFTRVRNINRGLDNGDDMNNDIRDLFDDIGDALAEPFNGNR
ncbi:YhcN/YlaJ family sporulation lipoprotein [Bacillus sp. FJAT-47783]|uniref:YhcN/YlaJ family sporulation lipoprotein n=1 Tax=Bacillus sp. FJAT-47783 TaxID=2922712 RepID=UPI001FADF56F|nr:YhcN/YlaJ family sporulation lipoprotein [Bacillus sp. FJAT-47783]